MRSHLPFTKQLVIQQVVVLLVIGSLGVAAVGWLLRDTLQRQYEQRALAVARTVAAQPHLAELVEERGQAQVQAIASANMKATGALFIVVTDDRGIRLAHPNPDEIGRRVSTDAEAALAGRESTRIERGTLGLSARGKVPLRLASGRVVGEVSVGFAAEDITQALLSALVVAIPCGAFVVLAGVGLTYALTRRMKTALFGLEPEQVADLLREHEAVLFAIGEGVVAFDREARVTMCNEEASRLLGKPLQRGVAATEMPLPRRVCTLIEQGGDAQATAVVGGRVLVARHRVVQAGQRELGSVLTLRDQTDVEHLTSELSSVRLMTEALRAQRHEFVNRTHTVIGLLQTGSAVDALEYLEASAVREAPSGRWAEVISSATVRAFLGGKVAYATERGVELTVSGSSWLPGKLLAPVEVVTVLGILVDNAIEAAGDLARTGGGQGRVVVDLLADGDELVLAVADSGAGVETSNVEKVFVDGYSTKGAERGLGLAIARQTARALGGELIMTSLGLSGCDTVFVARMPGVLEIEVAEVEA